MAEIEKYGQYYSEESFWDKVTQCAAAAGREVLIKAFQLYYVLDKPDVPVWVKSTIYGAIGYFIFPADLLPDIIPVGGYADDLGVLIGAISIAAIHVDDEVTAKAQNKVNQLLS